MSGQRGFGAVAAIAVLVILAALSAAIISVGTSQQMASAQDILSARAWQAARAGNEWGLYRALQAGQPWAGAACDANADGTLNTQTAPLDLTADTGFQVTVSCDSWLYSEGEELVGGTPQAKTVRIYRITAVACPAASCPATDATVAGAGYVERTRTVLATN
jgi:MSHA biogenesis protein MshP